MCGQRTDVCPSALSVAAIRSPPKYVYPYHIDAQHASSKKIYRAKTAKQSRNPDIHFLFSLCVYARDKLFRLLFTPKLQISLARLWYRFSLYEHERCHNLYSVRQIKIFEFVAEFLVFKAC